MAEPGGRSRSASARWRASTCATSPPATRRAIDEQLSERMNLVREIASLGRSARMATKLKVRQPLAKVEVILADRDASGVARGARRADPRRAERQEDRVHARGREIHHLPGAARTSSGSARGSASCCRRCKAALAEADARQAAGRADRQRQGDARPRRRDRSSSTTRTCRSACKPSPAGPPRKATSCVVVLSTELTPS